MVFEGTRKVKAGRTRQEAVQGRRSQCKDRQGRAVQGKACTPSNYHEIYMGQKPFPNPPDYDPVVLVEGRNTKKFEPP